MKNQSILIRNIPNFITSLNLVSGCIAIVLSLDPGLLIYAPWFIFLAALFDYCDGFAARLFLAYSEIGKQLDSLADVISFGVAPGMLVYQLMRMVLIGNNPMFSLTSLQAGEIIFLLSCFVIPVFGAFRLAKFNIDDSQKYSFKGLPIPANAFFFASLVILVYWTKSEALRNLVLNKYILLSFSLVFSFLMVSNIPMISLKFQNWNFRANLDKYIIIAGSMMLVLLHGVSGLAMVVPFYILVSVLSKVFSKKIPD